MAAILSDGTALEFASEALRHNKSFLLDAAPRTKRRTVGGRSGGTAAGGGVRGHVLLETSASLLVTSALLVVARSYYQVHRF